MSIPSKPAAPAPAYQGGQLRDRLANERTLLAWIRTALALMGFGLVVAKFSLFLELFPVVVGEPSTSHRGSHITGILLVVLGVLTALVGGQRTRAYARLLDPTGALPPDNRALVVTTVVVVAFGIGLALYLALYLAVAA